MKAAVYYETGPRSVFRYEDVPDPVCGPGDVLVDVEAVSIEGGDTLHRAGGEMATSPHVVGYQCAGTIAEVGADVHDRQPGQRVVCTMLWGSHAERVATPSIVTWVVPDGLDTIELAKRAGATVLATASSDEKLERLHEYGLDHGINYRTSEFPVVARELTGGRGVDLVVDSVGSTLAGSVQSLAYRGRVTLVGNAGRDPQPLDASMLMMASQTVTGVFLGAEITTDRVRANIARHLEDVAAGNLRVVVDRTFPLSDAAGAHEYIESRQAFGRVVLIP